MAAAMTLCIAATGCGQPAPQASGPVMAAPMRVTNGGAPFAFFEGAAAKRVAMATCAAEGRSLRTSIYDRFEAGTWVFVEGCA
jgi:hypothetical protein